MKIKRFETLLDRYGSDFDAWPAGIRDEGRWLVARSPEACRAHEALRTVESWLDATRPQVDPAAAARVVDRAVREVRAMSRGQTLFDRWSFLFAGTVPRLAFGLTATAIGFAIGLVVGSPDTIQTADQQRLPLTTASADDVLN